MTRTPPAAAPEIGWMADFGVVKHDPLPPRIGQVTVVRRTAAWAHLAERVAASGYRQRVPGDEVYQTREACVAGIRDRCLQLAAAHRETADAFEAAVTEPTEAP